MSPLEEQFRRREAAEEELRSNDYRRIGEDMWEDPAGHVMEFHEAFRLAMGRDYDERVQGITQVLVRAHDDEDHAPVAAQDCGEGVSP